ncbi:MAG: hypothetical protein AABX19_04810 [Nanoarchaeota archaeon]
MNQERKDVIKISSIGAFVASLCCFAPIILILISLGLTFIGIEIGFSKQDAGSLANVLYESYKWLFRSLGILLIILGLSIYFYKRYKNKFKNCSLDEKKRLRNKVINLIALSIIIGFFIYLVWLYIILEIIGIVLGIWG